MLYGNICINLSKYVPHLDLNSMRAHYMQTISCLHLLGPSKCSNLQGQLSDSFFTDSQRWWFFPPFSTWNGIWKWSIVTSITQEHALSNKKRKETITRSLMKLIAILKANSQLLIDSNQWWKILFSHGWGALDMTVVTWGVLSRMVEGTRSCVHMRWDSHVRWIFHARCTWGENTHAGWKYPCRVEIPMQGGNTHAGWKYPCRVEMAHRRWKKPHKVEMVHTRWKWPIQGGDGHVRWECLMQGRNCCVRWKCPTWGKNADAKWKWPHEVNCPHVVKIPHVRWECPCEVYEPPSEILHSLIFGGS